jgi:hypothetical protein
MRSDNWIEVGVLDSGFRFRGPGMTKEDRSYARD